MARLKLGQRKGKKTRHCALNPTTGKTAICVKAGMVYTFADGTRVYSWNIKEHTQQTYITADTHKGGPE